MKRIRKETEEKKQITNTNKRKEEEEEEEEKNIERDEHYASFSARIDRVLNDNCRQLRELWERDWQVFLDSGTHKYG